MWLADQNPPCPKRCLNIFENQESSRCIMKATYDMWHEIKFKLIKSQQHLRSYWQFCLVIPSLSSRNDLTSVMFSCINHGTHKKQWCQQNIDANSSTASTIQYMVYMMLTIRQVNNCSSINFKSNIFPKLRIANALQLPRASTRTQKHVGVWWKKRTTTRLSSERL